MISLSASNGFVVMPFNATGEIAAGDLRGLSNVAHRWHLPADSASNQGLGGGLGWVLESEFCEGIISRFPEESVVGGFNLMRFVTCVEIVEAEESFTGGLVIFGESLQVASWEKFRYTDEATERNRGGPE